MSTKSRVLCIAILSSLAVVSSAQDAEKLIRNSDCSSCHALDHKIVGPSYGDIAKRYAGQQDAVEKLAAKIRDGGSGMTPHPDLSEESRKQIVAWILSLKDVVTKASDVGEAHKYTLNDGSTVTLNFQMFVNDQGPKVTKAVFHGYQLYNSYCYRCHGTDATSSQLAPDLRRSLASGMKQPEFLSIAMSGKREQGMPSWAGFLTEEDVNQIYMYVKGRSLDLVPPGRPPSAQD